jgi:hypothetical protein
MKDTEEKENTSAKNNSKSPKPVVLESFIFSFNFEYKYIEKQSIVINIRLIVMAFIKSSESVFFKYKIPQSIANTGNRNQ